MNDAVDWIVIGRFGRVHGVKGWITIQSFTEPQENIAQYQPWFVKINGKWQPIDIESLQVHSNRILAFVEGRASREEAALLTNCEIAIPKDMLPELAEDEFYWHELTGMQVINKEGIALGNVVEIMPTGSNDVLVVQGEKQHLVPYLPGQFVVSIDRKNRKILVDWEADF